MCLLVIYTMMQATMSRELHPCCDSFPVQNIQVLDLLGLVCRALEDTNPQLGSFTQETDDMHVFRCATHEITTFSAC